LHAHSVVSRWLSSLATIAAGALAQAAALIIFARALGPSEFAIIVLATAIAAVAGEFVGLGAGDLLIREVSRDPQVHSREFGLALWSVGLTLIPMSAIATVIAWRCLDLAVGPFVLLALVMSEILATRTSFMAEQIAIAHHATHSANAVRILTISIRFTVVCLAVFVSRVTTVREWIVYALLTSAAIAAGSIGISARRFGSPDVKNGPGRWRYVGILFSLMQIVRSIQFSLDRFAVASVAQLSTVGAFGVASRASQLAMMPASAITRITYPRFFEEGAGGFAAAFNFGRRIGPAVVGLGIISSAALACIAWVLPMLLGSGYAGATRYLLLLSSLPLIAAMQNLAGDVLSGADFQIQRVIGATAGLIIACAAAFAGGRFYGVTGAIVGYMLGQFSIAAALWIMIAYVSRLAKRSPSSAQP
jgi:O-antigen/teichoic acid export membrane protein